MNLIEKWKKAGYLETDNEPLANLLEYMSTQTKEDDKLLEQVLPLTVTLFDAGVKSFDFSLIVYCLQHGKDDPVTMYKNLMK